MLRFAFFVVLVTMFPGEVLWGSEPVVVASGGKEGPKQPQAAFSDDGAIHVVYGMGEDVYYCCSSDDGKSFGEPSKAFRVPNLSLGMRRGPRIVVSGQSLIITAIGGKLGKGKDGDLLAWLSKDMGKSWQGPLRVNDSADSAREGLHAMAVGNNGEAWCTWLDLRNKKTELFGARSTDGGATWSANQLMYRSPDKSVCECCHPSIVVHDGKIHILFRNSIAGDRDMYLVSQSTDDSGSQSRSQFLGIGHWKLNACPMDGGMLAVDDSGLITTVWRRDRGIYLARNDGKVERQLGVGEQPWGCND